MKKFLTNNWSFPVAVFLIISIFVARDASAAMTFDLRSPQPQGTDITPTCTIGDTIEIFDSSGAWYMDMGPCDGANYFTIASDVGHFQIVEWNSATQVDDPTTLTFAQAIDDPGFVSQSFFSIGVNQPLFNFSSALPSKALASVSDTLADPGTLLVIVAVIALGVLFWVIAKLRDLFPKTVGKGYDTLDRAYLVKRRGSKKYREYLDGKN